MACRMADLFRIWSRVRLWQFARSPHLRASKSSLRNQDVIVIILIILRILFIIMLLLIIALILVMILKVILSAIIVIFVSCGRSSVGVDMRELQVPVATYLYDQRVVPCLTEVRELGCSQHGAHSPYITPIYYISFHFLFHYPNITPI